MVWYGYVSNHCMNCGFLENLLRKREKNDGNVLLAQHKLILRYKQKCLWKHQKHVRIVCLNDLLRASIMISIFGDVWQTRSHLRFIQQCLLYFVTISKCVGWKIQASFLIHSWGGSKHFPITCLGGKSWNNNDKPTHRTWKLQGFYNNLNKTIT